MNFIVNFLFSMFSTIAFSIITNIPRRAFLACGAPHDESGIYRINGKSRHGPSDCRRHRHRLHVHELDRTGA